MQIRQNSTFIQSEYFSSALKKNPKDKLLKEQEILGTLVIIHLPRL
jgi:hypothetical protein